MSMILSIIKAEALIFLDIMQKPNAIIVLLHVYIRKNRHANQLKAFKVTEHL
jgi:hypothetical protein